jgi:hypothetical protein
MLFGFGGKKKKKEKKIGPLGSWKEKSGRVSVMQGSAGLAGRPANRAIGSPGEKQQRGLFVWVT